MEFIGRVHAERPELDVCSFVAQRGEESFHRWALAAGLDQKKIVVLRRNGQEFEVIEPRHGLNCNSPIGAALGYRGGDGVVRELERNPAKWEPVRRKIAR